MASKTQELAISRHVFTEKFAKPIHLLTLDHVAPNLKLG